MRITLLFFLYYSLNLNAQKVIFPNHNIADCSGAVELLNAGNFNTEFTGKGGRIKDFFAYPTLSNFKETNSLFFKFIAPTNGKLSLVANISGGKFDLIIFKAVTSNIVDDIYYGKAKIEKLTNKPGSEISLIQDSLIKTSSPFINLKSDDVIMIVFNTEKGSKELLNFNVTFEISEMTENPDKLKKIIDERKNYQSATIEIQIRDVNTKIPIIANVNVKDRKKSSLYKGSDLIFNTEKINQLSVKCDAVGYFFYEETFKVYPDSSIVKEILLQAMSKGKKLKIDKLQFMKGTDQIYPSTESNLINIKDFLLLNSEIKIEIQGHVNNEGESDKASKSLSRKRARKVRNFFVGCGVHRKRLTVKAFSNKFPIYPNPKNEKESQENRRVEIKIL